MTDERCIHEQDWGEVKTKVRVMCADHVAHQREFQEFEKTITAQLKDLRNSNKVDFEKAERAAKETFVTKDEAESMIRVFYFFIAAIISYLMKELFL